MKFRSSTLPIPSARVLAFLLALAASSPAHAAQPSLGFAAANDNRTPAGTLADGVLTLRLEAREAFWHPLDEDGPALPVLAFAEEGGPATLPGPLIRVPAGTEIRATVRNTLSTRIVVNGLQTRPAQGGDGMAVAPGETLEVRFEAGEPGTYVYWASRGGGGVRGQMTGALVVDPPATPVDDRVFVLGIWFQPGDPAIGRPDREITTINGMSWPHTETLSVDQGDTLRWRVINASATAHPMHLHGFYFRVLSRGGWAADRRLPPDQRQLAVTETMLAGGTMEMEWVAERPGNWLFHCHFAAHMMNRLIGAGAVGATPATISSGREPSGHGHGETHAMNGMLLGIQVRPRAGAPPQEAPAEPRRIRLLVNQKLNHYGPYPGMTFVVQDGEEPARDSVAFPSPTLVLRQNEPVAVTVVNRLAEPTAVHWHGLEVDSHADGVPGWSGMGGSVMPPIEPGDSFTAYFTPPRAGTFIYHAHMNELTQINAGLYGALVVVPEAHELPENDRVFMVGGALIPDETGETGALVNGRRSPGPVDLTAGETYRFRLINIHPGVRVVFTIYGSECLARWTQVARDGAEVEDWERVERAAVLLTGPGETADFEFTPPEPGAYRLTVATLAAGWHIPILLRVSPRRP